MKHFCKWVGGGVFLCCVRKSGFSAVYFKIHISCSFAKLLIFSAVSEKNFRKCVFINTRMTQNSPFQEHISVSFIKRSKVCILEIHTPYQSENGSFFQSHKTNNYNTSQECKIIFILSMKHSQLINNQLKNIFL
jgi:hypothetical protein